MEHLKAAARKLGAWIYRHNLAPRGKIASWSFTCALKQAFESHKASNNAKGV